MQLLIGIIRFTFKELVKNANSHATPQNCWTKLCLALGQFVLGSFDFKSPVPADCGWNLHLCENLYSRTRKKTPKQYQPPSRCSISKVSSHIKKGLLLTLYENCLQYLLIFSIFSGVWEKTKMISRVTHNSKFLLTLKSERLWITWPGLLVSFYCQPDIT